MRRSIMIDVVDVALSQVGVKEKTGHNDGVPFERYALPKEQPLPWCARLCRWCFAQLGLALPGNPYEIASVAALQRALVDAGAWLGPDARPRRGDLVLFNERGMSDKDRFGHHVGIVIGVDPDGRLHTVEGNWGDQVARVTRTPRELVDVWGYARWPLTPAG
jgi:cell wall-associated NlpC family hydrolase